LQKTASLIDPRFAFKMGWPDAYGKVGSIGVSLSALPASLKYPYGVVVSGDKLYMTSSNAVVWTYRP
jgi:hypothetical protein